jgi:hypothetical protein
LYIPETFVLKAFTAATYVLFGRPETMKRRRMGGAKQNPSATFRETQKKNRSHREEQEDLTAKEECKEKKQCLTSKNKKMKLPVTRRK